jgi:hypothetical protein
MKSDPSAAGNLKEYLLSLAQIENILKIESHLLLPSFDPLDSEVRKAVDWSSLEITEISSEMTGLSHLPKVSPWRLLIMKSLEDEKLSSFVNIYIYVTIDNLIEALMENYGSAEDLREDWDFYDLLCDYKYLDKRVKEAIELSSTHVEEMRPF